MKRFYPFALLLTGFLFATNLSATDLYWVGGTGSWSNTAHWSTTSGGAGCSCTPAAGDNVYFDANSFSANGQSVTIDVTAYCDSMNWAGAAHACIMTGSSALHINGSLILSSNSSVVNFTGGVYFDANNANNIITSAGKPFGTNIYFSGNGDWTLQDAFATNAYIYLNSGTLNTNNNNLTCDHFSSTGSTVRSLILGSSTVTVSGNGTGWNITGTNFALDAGTSLIKFTTTSSYTYLTAGTNDVYYDLLWTDPNVGGYINGGTSTYHNITISGGGNISPAGGSFFNDITFNGPATATISVGSGSIFHDVTFNGNGNLSPGTSCTFNNVSIAGTGTVSTSGTTINNILFTGPASVYNPNGSFVKADFKNDANITSNNTFDSLLFASGRTYTLNAGTTQTILSFFKADGNCSQPVTIKSNTTGSQATLSKTSGTVSVNYVNMRDINATGGAIFITNNSTNLSNNTGWTINTPVGQSLYWVGGTGNWSDNAHWSGSSGGAAGACIPTIYDNVYFDANSFTSNGQSVTVDVVAYCDSMDWSGIGFSNILTGTSSLNIYGSLRLSPTLNVSNFTGGLAFQSNNNGNVIVSSGRTFASSIYFTGTGDWTLLDAFATSAYLYLSSGTLTTGSKNLTCDHFASTGNSARSLLLGSSLVTVTGNGTGWNITGTNFALDAGTSLLKFTTTSSYTYLTAGTNDVYYDVLFVDPNVGGYINGGTSTFHNVTSNGGGNISPAAGSFFNDVVFNGPATATVSVGGASTFHNVTFGGSGNVSPGASCTFNNVSIAGTATVSTTGTNFNAVVFNGSATVYNPNGLFVKADFKSDGTFTSSNNFDTLLFASAHYYTLTAGTVQNIVNYFKADGTCSEPVSIRSNTFGSQAAINKTSGTVTTSYLSLRDISATGGATFNVSNATDLGNNTGWTLNNAAGQNLYWVGGAGNWSSTTHWSTSSGGAPGACIPTIYDNVYFDANSFTANGQAVTIDITAYCDSMDWSGITHTNLLTGALSLNIYGSLTLSPSVNVNNFSGGLVFQSNTVNNKIFSAGKSFTTNIYFNGSGDWTLQDDFATNAYIYLNNGTLSTNNNNFSCDHFSSTGNNIRSLILGTSTVTVTGNGTGWNVTGSNFALDAGTSLIKFTTISSYTYLTAGTNDVYYDVLFVDPNIGGYINGGTSTYHNVTVNGGGNISPAGGSFFNDLTFNGPATATVSVGGGSTFHNVIFSGPGNVSPGAGCSFHNVTFVSTATVSSSSTNFNNVVFNGSATISDAGGTFVNANFKHDASFTSNNITFDTLIFAAGRNYTIASSTTQNIINYFKADGTCSQLVNIHSSSAGTQASFSKATDSVTLRYVNMKDINATGGAVFTAINSTNVSNNTGWNFPSANLQAAYTSAQNGLTVTFTNASQYSTSYYWDFGDSAASALQDPVHTFPAPGSYNVCLIAANACGSTDTLCQMFTVCTPLATGFTDTIIGQTAYFTNISQNANSYLWNFGDGTTSTLPSPVHTYFYAGGYNVVLIATSNCGARDTIHQLISVNCTPPVAGFAVSVSGLMVNFANSSTNAAALVWDYGDGSGSSSLNAAHTYYNSGSYTVTLIAGNGCGADTFAQIINVSCVAPVASYSNAANGMAVNYTNTSSNAALSFWDFGDGQTSTLSNPSHVYLNAGTYAVKLKVKNGCGIDSVTQSIVVTCVMPVASFVSNQQGLTVDFVSTSANAPNVIWNFGDATGISILASVNHTYSATGTYNVCLTASNGCGSTTACVPISVCTPPAANFTYTASGLDLSLTNTSINGTNFLWTFGDSSATNFSSPAHTYLASGTKQVCLEASNSCGNSSICKTIKIFCYTAVNPEICMVAVDTGSTHNIIYWDTANYTGIDSFIVQREITTGNYQVVGKVQKGQAGEFHDYSANPNGNTYRYKLGVKDSCGNFASVITPFHNTIYIQQTNGTFNWSGTQYKIENVVNPVSYYVLERDSLSNGIWDSINSCPGTQYIMSDNNWTNQHFARWRVRTVWNRSCDALFMKQAPGVGTYAIINTSRSNIKNQKVASIGIASNSFSEKDFSVYPNPASGLITLEFNFSQKNAVIEIVDVTGRIVYSEQQTSDIKQQVINISAIANGVYTIRLSCKGGNVMRKLIIEK